MEKCHFQSSGEPPTSARPKTSSASTQQYSGCSLLCCSTTKKLGSIVAATSIGPLPLKFVVLPNILHGQCSLLEYGRLSSDPCFNTTTGKERLVVPCLDGVPAAAAASFSNEAAAIMVS
ncbi:hypothetical protein ACH5RR_006591 [Cinchona calisaya]|uniref:Uncharacterized protein n=1 Tax=Cinchona calisaya TaxID=153742 RepID=A0ABD3APF8_9GENT